MLSPRYTNDGAAVLSLNPAQLAARDAFLEKLGSGHYQLESQDCLICSGRSFEPVAEKDRYGLPVSVMICRDCGLVQTSPRLTEAANREFYDSEYRPLYVGTERPTHAFFCRQVEQGQKIIHRLETKARFKFCGQTVVEIGCGAGGILEAFNKRGCQVMGFDWGTDYLKFGRNEFGLDLRVGGLMALPAQIKPDLVIYSHVLEHVSDPRAELRQLHSRLRPDALIYIEVPGVKNVARAYEGDFLQYLQNAHISHFTQQTLTNLLTLEHFTAVFSDEAVECLCQPTAQVTTMRMVNDYESVSAYLHATEASRLRRRWNPARQLRKHSVAALSRLGLKESVRRVWQR